MRNFYLLGIRLAGIKNIKEPIELSFYKKTINRDFNPEKYKVKAIYGENGSGKTAIVSAVWILQKLLTDKSFLGDKTNQKYLYETVNKNSKSGFVECEFILSSGGNGLIFRYYISFEVREDNRFYITGERLQVKKGGYSKNQFETQFETQNGELTYWVDEELFDVIKKKTQNLLDQRVLLQCIWESLPDDFKVFDRSLYNFLMILQLFAYSIRTYLDEADNHGVYFGVKKIRGLDEELLKKIDRQILDLIYNHLIAMSNEDYVPKFYFDRYKKSIEKMETFIRIFKPELKKIVVKETDANEYYKCNLILDYGDYSIDKEFESRGIKKLMNLFRVLDSAARGEIVFIDELDANINDVYLGKIIEYFINYGEGQLCFTAHNLSPMKCLKGNSESITFISSINTVHTWTKNGNYTPENAYRNGFIEDSPFNVEASDFLGVIGGDDE